MDRRIINTELKKEEAVMENNLRPSSLKEYIGQRKVKDIMCCFMDRQDLERPHLHVLLLKRWG